MSTGTQALVQSSVDNALRARVMSLYTMIYRGVPALGAVVIGWLADRIGLQLAFIIATLLCVIPWITAFAKRASITLALEGHGNNLDERLLAASRAMAGVAYEQMVDLKSRATPLAGMLKHQTKTLAAKARVSKISEKLQALKHRARRDDLS
jgi:MFS family permease